MPTTPTKRGHSQISKPPKSSTSSNKNSHQSHNPFDNILQMFHRSSRSVQQQSSDVQSLDNEHYPSQPTKPTQQSTQQKSGQQPTKQHQPTEYDVMLNNQLKSAYVPPRLHNVAVASKQRSVSPTHSSTSSIRTTSPSPTNNDRYANLRPSSSRTTAASYTRTSQSKISSTSISTASNTAVASAWRTALCPRSNKTYYWNTMTRESRWKKPIELASDEERLAIQSKEMKQRAFFDSMERNILKRLENGMAMKAMQEKELEESSSMTGGLSREEGSMTSLDNYNATSTCPSVNGTATSSSVTSGGSGTKRGIDQSWTQISDNTGTAASPTEMGNDDWIAGWITPNSESQFGQQQQQQQADAVSSTSCGLGGKGLDRSASPSGSSLPSLSSLEGLSVLDPHNHNSGSFSPVSIDTSSITSTDFNDGSIGSSISREERDDKLYPLKSKIQRIKSSSSKPVIDKPNLIRTISKMEYDLVKQLNPGLLNIQAQASAYRHDPLGYSLGNGLDSPRTTGRSDTKRDDEPLTPTTMTCDILSALQLTHDTDGLNVSLLDPMTRCMTSSMPISPTSPLTPNDVDEDEKPPVRSSSSGSPSSDVTKPNLTKRNTCGTIYLGSTLSAPDKDALIKCVCGVYRAHLVQAERSAIMGMNTTHHIIHGADVHAIFHDRRAPGDYRYLDTTSVPSLDAITDFYRSIFLRSQMEVDCIIISLIYIERLIKLTDGKLTPSSNNWRSILFSCMVLASKVWDDLSMWNCDFSKIGPGGVTFSLSRTNELEIALLRALEYKVKVNASEYAKYYFLLRGMLCRSGLASDEITRLEPLDVKGAATLAGDTGPSERANAATNCENGTVTTVIAKLSLKERSKSYGHVEAASAAASVDNQSEATSQDTGKGTEALPPQSSPASKRVSLEQIVRMG